jgi:oligopeptide transport system substrate-binding protein
MPGSARDPATASPYAWYIELMKVAGAAEIIAGEAAPDTLGVRAVDDHTFEVTLTSPLPYFPQMVTHTTTFRCRAGHRGAWRPVDPAGNLVGNGAYVLSERVPQERIFSTRNPSTGTTPTPSSRRWASTSSWTKARR